jgi:carboxyl-terminal processing protease
MRSWCARLCSLVLMLGLLASSAHAQEKVFGGVGLQVVPLVTGELVVLGVVTGSPAAAGGVLPGDLIIRIDDFPMRGSDFAEVVPRRLWGEVGSSVTLEYLRPGEAGRRSVTLRRVPLKPDAPSPPGVRMLAPGKN